ncbi:MAG TPA: hypothetical protein DD640_01585 [Clostridiales bacterium]|nr:hypothetical protein [Clostridiales bacterium]
MAGKIIVKTENEVRFAPETEGFCPAPSYPYFRFDARKFIWEEGFWDGNLIGLHFSASGHSHMKEMAPLTIAKHYAYEAGNGYLRAYLPTFALEVNGVLLRNQWRYAGQEQIRTASGEELVVTLEYPNPKVRVKVRTALDGSSFIARSLEIVNLGSEPAVISRVYPFCGIIGKEEEFAFETESSDCGYSVASYNYGGWYAEGELHFNKLDGADLKYGVQNQLFSPPLYFVKNDRTGEMTVLDLAWSGNIDVEFKKLFKDRTRYEHPHSKYYLYAKVGLGGPAPLRVLRPGESVTTPAVHVAMFYGDLDTCANELHAHLRDSVLLAHADNCNIAYNLTGYSQNMQVDDAFIRREIDTAAAIGAETVILDAGWFGHNAKIWGYNVGDWFENEFLAGKLADVFAYARDQGLKTGLWLEIERAMPDSELRRRVGEDGMLHQNGHPLWLLDFSRPEVQDAAFDTISGCIRKYKLDSYRLDCNVDMLTGGELENCGFTENTMWRYFEGFYSVIDRLREEFPGLLLENCASGGGRTDIGIMQHFHYTQVSDNAHPLQFVRIIAGMLYALPPEKLYATIGVHFGLITADIDFMVRATLLTRPWLVGFFPSPADANEEALAQVRHGLQLYKDFIRPLIMGGCRVYHHTPLEIYEERGNWLALEYAAPDKTRACGFFFRLSDKNEPDFVFKPRGIDAGKTYRVTSDNSRETAILTGYQLKSAGFAVTLPNSFLSELILIEEVRN